jgi:hypothetical protein
MFALIFLLLGIVFLLAAAGRIWLDPAPSGSRIVDSTATNSPGKSVTLNDMSAGKDSVL